MKSSLALLVFSLLASSALADEFSDRFQELRKAEDHKAMVKFLEEAAKTQADNANYYALASNYWWSVAGTAIISTKPAEEGEFKLEKKDTGEAAGSITEAGRLDPTLRQKALDLTTEGFKRFPERLDIGLGLASVQTRMDQTAASVETLLTLLKVSKEKAATLKWGDNKPLPEPAATLVPEAIQGYTVPLLEAGDEASTKLCKQLCDATIAAYPDHPFAYNVLAALADARDDKAEVMKMLKLAQSKAPDDALILLNLAEAQRGAKQEKEALAAYKKILEMEADDELKEAAKEGIKELEAGDKR